MVQFKCTHCGACCLYPTSQVNVTLGDIYRISKHTGTSPEAIVKEYLDITPFFNPDDPSKFTLEPGLHKPCKFWKDGRCSIYESRPLNCRLFPIWMFAKLDRKQVREATIPGYECVENTKIVDEDKKAYNEYTDELGKILDSESKITEDFLRRNNFPKELDLHTFSELIISGNLPQDNKMAILMKLLENSKKKAEFAALPEKVGQELSESDVSPYQIISKLKRIEKILS